MQQVKLEMNLDLGLISLNMSSITPEAITSGKNVAAS